MTNKVVQGADIFFKDDVKIIDSEIAAPLSLPVPYPLFSLFSEEGLLLIYKGDIYATKKGAASGKPDKLGETDKSDNLIKLYSDVYLLGKASAIRDEEEKYFSTNKSKIDKLKEDFIERSVNGIYIHELKDTKSSLGPHIASGLEKKINDYYNTAGTPASAHAAGTTAPALAANASDSVFGTYMPDLQKILLADSRVYNLVTLPEYISKFEQSFKPSFFADVLAMSQTATPEEVSKYLTQNADKVHRKALPLVRNKIWFNDRSVKVLLDRTYWIPQLACKADELAKKYAKCIEQKVKQDAAKEYA